MRPVGSSFLVILTILLSACAPQNQKLNSSVDQLTTSLNDLRSLQAEQVAQIDSMRAAVRDLSGRVDLLEHKQQGEITSDLSAVKQDLSAMKNRMPPPAIVPAEALEEDEQVADLFPTEVAQKYIDALGRIREGKFQVSMGILEEVLDVANGAKVAPYAIFWLALSEEGANQNARAVQHYAEIISRYSKHKRAPLALLRQGSVLIRMGDTKAAKLTLKKLVADFPKSSEAVRARDRLKGL